MHTYTFQTPIIIRLYFLYTFFNYACNHIIAKPPYHHHQLSTTTTTALLPLSPPPPQKPLPQAPSPPQGVLEFVHKNDSFHFIHDGDSDYTLFGHGGMIFWFTSSFILSLVRVVWLGVICVWLLWLGAVFGGVV